MPTDEKCLQANATEMHASHIIYEFLAMYSSCDNFYCPLRSKSLFLLALKFIFGGVPVEFLPPFMFTLRCDVVKLFISCAFVEQQKSSLCPLTD